MESLKEIQNNRIFSSTIFFNVAKVLLIAPLFEELAFRFSLNLKKRFVMVSKACVRGNLVNHN